HGEQARLVFPDSEAQSGASLVEIVDVAALGVECVGDDDPLEEGDPGRCRTVRRHKGFPCVATIPGWTTLAGRGRGSSWRPGPRNRRVKRRERDRRDDALFRVPQCGPGIT